MPQIPPTRFHLCLVSCFRLQSLSQEVHELVSWPVHSRRRSEEQMRFPERLKHVQGRSRTTVAYPCGVDHSPISPALHPEPATQITNS